MRTFVTGFAASAFLLFASLSAHAAPPAPTQVDQFITAENAGKSVAGAPAIDDLTYLRRVSLDLIGRIPNEKEIREYMAMPAGDRRAKLVDRLIADERFTDRWAVFFADMLRIRSGQTGGTALLAFVHQAVKDGMPYDEMVRRMISANGKAGKTPEVGFILGDDADPMALAGATAQTFLGIRIACAQCHDHPFDKWSQEEFYSFAAFFGKTQRVESRFNRSIYTTEGNQNRVMWPPAEPGVTNRKPVPPAFLYQVNHGTLTPAVARLEKLRAAEAEKARGAASKTASIDDILAGVDTDKATKKAPTFDVAGNAKQEIKKIDVEADLYRKSEWRHNLGQLITDPNNRNFSWAITNRVWKELVGRAFVEPVDDFKSTNKASHPKAFDYLSDEFVASGFNFRSLVRMIVLSETYSRGHLTNVSEEARTAAEEAFVAAPMRRMLAEALFDSVVEAGHLWDVKWPEGANKRTIRQAVRIRIDEEGKPAKATSVAASGAGDEKMAMQPRMMVEKAPMSGYNLEQAIEVDFSKVLAAAMKDDEPKIEMMEAISPEDLEARNMLMERQNAPRARFITRYVEVEIGYNPKFTSSMRMESPAPRPHFLRVFGQPAREALGEEREELPSMRQALMLLNGSLTNEAARVGTLEPMHKLLTGPKPDVTAAVRLAYREIMTREASAAEIAFAKEIIAGAESPVEGMADLRWALLNSNEFRYIP
ncbi:MAG: DUF1549 domain-containing protein [Phycisphaeraceae bacterium]